MAKIVPTKPLLVLLYGLPGSGKTTFARELTRELAAAHIHDDKIRTELFENPSGSAEENHIVNSLMNYMTGEFLRSGLSVVYDTGAIRATRRQALRQLAAKMGAETVLVWVQTDPTTAWQRASTRDKRRDRYARAWTRETFDKHQRGAQAPASNEPYQVISGKHVFGTQKNALVRHLIDRRLVRAAAPTAQTGKPGMVNLVPKPEILSRRNINIQG